MPWVAIAAAAAGAIAGGQKDKTKTVSSMGYSDSIKLQDFNTLSEGQSELEKQSYEGRQRDYGALGSLVGAGPGQNEVAGNLQYQNQFASLLQSLLSKSTGPTSASDMNAYTGEAQRLFAPQQEQLNQQFQDEATNARRLSAKLGRPTNDPILQNKLMQEKTRQQSMLNANIGSYAQQLPDVYANRALNIGGALSNLRQGLASQALTNRSTLLSMGNELANSERNYRLQAANRYGTKESDVSTYSGGGFKGAVNGGLQGFSAGGGMGAFSGGGGSGGGGSMGGGAVPQRSSYFG